MVAQQLQQLHQQLQRLIHYRQHQQYIISK
jgi:hypothetical protein